MDCCPSILPHLCWQYMCIATLFLPGTPFKQINLPSYSTLIITKWLRKLPNLLFTICHLVIIPIKFISFLQFSHVRLVAKVAILLSWPYLYFIL